MVQQLRQLKTETTAGGGSGLHPYILPNEATLRCAVYTATGTESLCRDERGFAGMCRIPEVPDGVRGREVVSQGWPVRLGVKSTVLSCEMVSSSDSGTCFW